MNPHVEVEIEQVRRYLVDNIQSFSKTPGNAWSSGRQTLADTKDKNGKHIGGGQREVRAWNTLPSRILAASPHLQGYDVPGEEIDRLKAEGLTLLEALERLGM